MNNQPIPRLRKTAQLQIKEHLKKNTPFVLLPESNWETKRDEFLERLESFPLTLLRYHKTDPAATRNNATYLKTSYSAIVKNMDAYKKSSDYTYNVASDIRNLGQDIGKSVFEQFAPDVVSYSVLEEINFWVNFGGDPSGLHYDVYDNFNFQLSGKKVFYIAPPGWKKYHAKKVSTFQGHTSSYGNIRNLREHASDREVQEQLNEFSEVELNCGELLYLPTCWWHEVHAKDSLNTNVNFWWRSESKLLFKFLPQLYTSLWTYAYRKAKGI